MTANNKNLCLTLSERQIIETGITNGSTKTAIAKTIGKDNSTVGKEIRNHRTLKHKCSMPLECDNYHHCIFKRQCTLECPEYKPFKCPRRDRSPGACNGCSSYSSCRFDKYYYSAREAQNEYEEVLRDSRVGANLTTSEAKAIADTAKPLLDQGQSPHMILNAHPELGICAKTMYNYIEDGTLEQFGIISLDLRRQPGRKMTKKKAQQYKKRQDRSFLKGRTYADYRELVSKGNWNIVQMDTVYNDGSNGPFMQTFKFLNYGFLFVVYQEKKDSQHMLQGIELLEQILGRELFEKEVQIILTDRGSEFSGAQEAENRADGTRRTRIFYCDAMASGQKGSLENKHIELRYICPKGCDLYNLGLTSQEKANLVVSHLNSVPEKSMCDKTAIEMMRFLNNNLLQKFLDYGIREIEKDKVVLKPYLIKE